MPTELEHYAELDFCYLTTRGRVTGRPHTIEIWFALHGHTLYMLAGDREKADWIKNIQREPQVQVKLGEEVFSGKGHIVLSDSEQDALARQIVSEKYTPRSSDDLTEWSQTSLPVAVDLAV